MPGQHGFQGRFIGWAAVAVLAAYALFVGGAWGPTYSVWFRVLTLIIATSGIAVWIVVAIRDPFWRPRSALAPAFAAAFIVFAISTVTSRMPRISVEYLAWAVILAALYLFLQRLMASEFFRVRLVGFAIIAGVATGVAYIAVTVPHWITWWTTIGRLTAPPLRPNFESLTWGNPSAVMTVSLLLAVPAVAHLWGDSRARSALAVAIVVLSMAVILISGSRSGWLAIGIGIVVVGALWLAAAERRASLVAIARSRAARIAAISVLLAGLSAAVIIGPGLLLRAASGGENLRTSFYVTAIRMFEASPFVGTGPGTWVAQRVAFTQPGESDYYIPHAHSIYLQTLAEFGILGVVAGAGVVCFLARLLLGAVRDPDPARRRMGWVAIFATVYFAAHQLLDFYANAPAILFAFAIPIAWLDATASPDRSPTFRWDRLHVPPSLRVPAALAGVVAVAASVAFLGWSEQAAFKMNDGTILLNDRLEGAVKPLEAAVTADPEMPPYHLALGLALAEDGDLARAAREFEASARLDDLPESWLNLAAIRADLSDPSGAREALARAMRLGNQQSAVAIGAGVVYLRLGDRDAAVSAFARTLTLSPSLAGDPWWRTDSGRAALWPDVLSAAQDQVSPPLRFEMALETGDLVAARRAIAQIDDPSAAKTASLILAAWFGDPIALSELQTQARANIFEAGVVNWCARLLRRAGDHTGAAAYAAWAESINGLSSVGGFETRVVSREEAHVVAGVNTLFYGHYTYRRPTPTNQFVPGLPQLGYQ